MQWVHIAWGQAALLAPGPTDTQCQAAVLGALGPTGHTVPGCSAGSTGAYSVLGPTDTVLAQRRLQSRVLQACKG